MVVGFLDAMTPHRVQLSRKKGWRMPENTVKVDRTTRWGNPFQAGSIFHKTAISAVSAYKRRVLSALNRSSVPFSPYFHRISNELPALRGKNLACWCPLDQLCHADVLLELANK